MHRYFAALLLGAIGTVCSLNDQAQRVHFTLAPKWLTRLLGSAKAE